MINFLRSNVLVYPGELVSRSSGGVLFPNMSIRPYNFGIVVAAGPRSNKYPLTVREGDVVAYHMEDAGEVDGTNKALVELDGEPHMVMDEAMIQAVVTNPEMKNLIGNAIKNKQKVEFEIDYRNDVRMCGFRVAIELRKPDEATPAGVILPEFKMNKATSYGTIVAVSDMANSIFMANDELVPGMEVIVDRAPSGGVMPMSGDKTIWRVNAHEIAAKFDANTERWKPVGGRAFLRPVHMFMRKKKEKIPHPTIIGVETEHEVWIDTRNPSIAYPITHRFMPFQSEVVDVGCGWNEQYGLAKQYGEYGTPPYKAGDIVMHLQIINQHGEIARGVEEIEINGEKEILMMPTSVIEGVITGHSLNKFQELSLTPPDHGL
jgi:co-chaperonin GroES (HSP10)